MGDFASMVYKFAKFDGPCAVENPPDHYNKCFHQSIIHGVCRLQTNVTFIFQTKLRARER